jgi:hypothetical protein
MKHVPLRECAYAIIFVVALLCLYGGAYLAMMERVDLYTSIGGEETPIATYRFGGEGSETFFSVAHEVDRQLRPDFWKGERIAIRLRRLNNMYLSK